MIKKVNIIGAGNVATHLAKHLFQNVKICSIYSKNIDNANELAIIVDAVGVNNLSHISEGVDLNIIALKDDVIITVADRLPKNIPIVHTSGSMKIDVFKDFNNCGILYPLQTFSKNSNLIIEEIPFLLEGNNDSFVNELTDFCKLNLSPICHLTDSAIRSEIHLAAVISNNFMTALLAESEQVLLKSGLTLELLKPLLIETLRKSFEVGPSHSQTGPAKRGDSEVIKTQLSKISNPKLKEVYSLLSELISDKYN